MSILDDLVIIAKAAGMERAWPIGGVPPSPAYRYAVIGGDTGTPGLRRMGGGSTRKDRRFTVGMLARTEDELLGLADIADAAFEDKVLGSLPGRPFSMREDLRAPIIRDADTSGVLYLLHTYKLLEA